MSININGYMICIYIYICRCIDVGFLYVTNFCLFSISSNGEKAETILTVAVVVVVVAAAVLKMHDSQATFGSRCFKESYVIFRFVSDCKSLLTQ